MTITKTVNPNNIINSALLLDLSLNGIDINIERSIDVESPRNKAKCVWVGTDSELVAMPDQDGNTRTVDYVKWYFSEMGIDHETHDWLAVKKNVIGYFVVTDQRYSLINNTDGFIYSKVGSENLLDLFQYELEKYNSWKNNMVFDIHLSCKEKPELSKTIRHYDCIGDDMQLEIEHQMRQLSLKMKELACNMELVINCKRDDVPNKLTPVDYLRTSFLSYHGVDLTIDKHNYSIARKELTVTIDPKCLSDIQVVYDQTECALIGSMMEYLEDYNIDGWDVMRLFLSRAPLIEWDEHTLGAWIYALFKDMDNLNDPRISFRVNKE